MAFEQESVRLKSGLSLVKVPMQTGSVTIMALIKAGSKDEFGGKWGAAHFLEHFVFKGTRKFPKVNDVTKVIDGIGGKQNAFTWTDFTGYWVKVASSQFGKGLEVVSQLVSEPLLPEEELEKEKGTIVEEIKMIEDDYPKKAWRVFQGLLFPDSAIGRPVIGYEETVKAMKRDDLEAFLNRWYIPENMVVVVAGGLSQVENLDKQVEDSFAAIGEKRSVEVREDGPQVFTQDSPRVEVVNKQTEQAHVMMGLRSFGFEDERVYGLWVANQILGGNMSSRLWNEVREKRGLAYYVGSGFFAHEQTGAFYARAGVKLSKAQEAVKVIREEMLKMADKKVSDEELIMGKEGVRGNFLLDLEDSQEVASFMAEDWAMRKGKTRRVDEVLKAIEEVSAGDIRRIMAEVVVANQFNLSVVGPFESKDKFVKVME